MGLFTPKYPKGAEPPRKDSRADRKSREFHERLDKQMEDDFKRLHRESKERSAHFWQDYEQRNGPGSVDWS
ncbi:hypothetical protein J7E97_08055 [Streptomyces sp. ISL-66]|uniref:hypothetical protein n=1 Tax=Streptomyces sp. ISL-66 TaxID=2819186 RepID=UPI001BECA337|nr:hypothetical protein [Streptomyces sp. ISL-66]MBT2467826.1 hypothetical protein [Streptomyces sp. ISL-66]